MYATSEKPHSIALTGTAGPPDRGGGGWPGAMPGDDTAVRVVTGEIPVRLPVFYPSTVSVTHLPQVGQSP